jgi:cytochrome P450
MSATTYDVPTMDVDLWDWKFNQDPYPTLEAIRGLGPVVYNPVYDHYLVTSHSNCAQVLRDSNRFDAHNSRDLRIALFGGVTMPSLEGEHHRRVRSIWSEEFQRGTLQGRAELIRQIVADQVDPFVQRLRSGETLDVVPTIRAVPILVIATLLGTDPAMRDQLLGWSSQMAATLEAQFAHSPRKEELGQIGAEATRALNAYLAEEISARRRHSAGDLAGQMVASEYAKEMEDQDIIASCTELMFAGNETTAKLITTTLVALAEHPDQRRAVVEDRSLIAQTVEEAHRWRSIVGGAPRDACSDASDIEGVRIPNGARVLPLQMAGNRDAERWDRPEEFDIFRAPRQHLGFGFGVHICLGMNLARIEAQLFLDRWLDLMPEYEIGPIDYGLTFIVRAPTTVPVGAG